MEIHKLSVAVCFLPVLLSAETVYRSVDEKGRVLFTDTPTENAEKITPRKINTMSMPRQLEPAPVMEEQDEQTSYTTLAIVNPVDNQVIIGTQGNFTVDVDLKPALAEQDKLVLLMDGKMLQSGETTSLTLSNIDRGAHTLQAAIRRDNNKKLLKRSNKVTVHVRRTARLDPQFVPDPNVVSPVNPPKPPVPDVSPVNPPKPKIPQSNRN